MMSRWMFAIVVTWSSAFTLSAQDPVFSGPQVGEKIHPFKTRGIFEEGGKELDFEALSKNKALLLIFVHELNRPSVALVRSLTAFAKTRSDQKMVTGVVFLGDDANDVEARLNRSRHALTPGILTGISLDGREGPGSYGLNRNVSVTILIAKEGRVESNFALVQPSLQVDLPKIVDSIVKAVGGPSPSPDELKSLHEPMRPNPSTISGQAPDVRELIRPLIQKSATDREVDLAAKAIIEKSEKDESVRREVVRIAKTIVEGGKVENYGTSRTQQYLRFWSEKGVLPLP